MFAKVARRVRRRSTAGSITLPPPQEAAIQVDIAPELLRWADFSTPFPSVSLGGYSRFYKLHTTPETESLRFCPLLSQQPEPSPSSEIPRKYPLFDSLRRKSLPLIREGSLESLTSNLKPNDLTITTSTTPLRALKRRHRQLLRTPSIERDFALVSLRCRSPSDSTSITINTLSDDATTPTPTDTPPSPRSNYSSESRLSHDRSDSNHSVFPITPASSIEGDILSTTEFLDKLPSISSTPHTAEYESESESVMTSPISPSSCYTMKSCFMDESVETRPLSAISCLSYRTAKSDFSEI